MSTTHAMPASPIEHETLGDAQVRHLIDAYARLSGTTATEVAPHLYEMTIPERDRAAFGDRETVRLAFSVEAVQVDPEAEMAIVGSAFVGQLITAIRARGTKLVAGRIGGGDSKAAEPPLLPIRIHRGSAGAPASQFARHPIGRLTARVVIRAGASVEEHLVDSAVFDLATGLALGPDISAACTAGHPEPLTSHPERSERVPAQAGAAPDVELAPARKPKELLNQMLSELELQLRPQLHHMREESQRELANEIVRIDRYYRALIDDAAKRNAEDLEARDVYEAERERRSDEERERHQVRATLHPVQLTAGKARERTSLA